MKNNFPKFLLGSALALTAVMTKAQGLEDVIVEEYHTITQADADAYNLNFGGGSYPLVAGMKTYRVYLDLAPGYKLLQVYGDPIPQGQSVTANPLDFTTTTTFWNDDDFGSELPGQTRRFDEGNAFDSYITVNTSGIAGGTAGCGSNVAVFGVPKAEDTDGNLTMCTAYPSFVGADGNIPGAGPTLTYNLGGTMNFAALTGNGNNFTIVNEGWTTLPGSQGPDPLGTNRILIAQLTTDGQFTFHLNVDISSPSNVPENYVWNQVQYAGQQVSPLLTYPQPVLPNDCEGVPGGSALPGTPCDDLDASTGNDTWDANCMCVGQLIDCEGVAGGSALPGTACDDMNPATINDVYDANCVCAGTLLPNDCLGVPGGSALPGTPCDDLDPSTGNDTWDANCMCVGQVIDCEGVAGGSALPGTACDDMNPATINDVYDANCVCAGTLLPNDCLGVPGGSALPGTACDDMNPATINDVYDANCVCAGTLLQNDCLGVPGGSALPGTPCDDLDPSTGNDTWDANCMCVGQVIDCEGVAGGSALPGTACDDMNPATINDVYDANCVCAGTLLPNDCLGVPGGSALPGTACDDMNPATINDVYDANCVCAGTLLQNDCLGVPGGSALPGTPCDDLDPSTGNDTWDANCMCVGQVIDCEGVAGGSALPGTTCDDMNPATINDVYDANCVCAGTPLQNDCLGVPGGSALPGTPCDDLDPSTGNDTWDANCMCVGQVIDCEGVAGGSALPGTACDDMNPATINDVYDANCVCAGTPIGGCTEIIHLDITLDNFGSETTWEIYDANGIQLIAFGGPYADGLAGTVITEDICLNQTCYRLLVNDDGGNGIANGGYVLRDDLGSRIIVGNGEFGSMSSIANGQTFCLPLSNQGLIASQCDALSLTYASSTQLYASSQPGATGYQFWLFDAHGSYSRKVFQAAQNLRPLWLQTNPVPADLDLNVRVRAFVNGAYTDWGRSCVIRLNAPVTSALRTSSFDEASATVMTLFPNPTREQVVYLRMEGLEESETRIVIDVYDAFGKRVFAEQYTQSGAEFNYAMDLGSDLPAGMYMVNVTIGETLFTQRLVRQ